MFVAIKYKEGGVSVMQSAIFFDEATHGEFGHVQANEMFAAMTVLLGGSGLNEGHAWMRFDCHLERVLYVVRWHYILKDELIFCAFVNKN